MGCYPAQGAGDEKIGVSNHDATTTRVRFLLSMLMLCDEVCYFYVNSREQLMSTQALILVASDNPELLRGWTLYAYMKIFLARLIA